MLCACLLSSSASNAQWQLQNNPKKDLKIARNLADQKKAAVAAWYYRSAMSKEKDPELVMEAAEVMRKAGFYSAAANLYRQVINLDFEKYPLARLLLGQCLQQCDEYDKAAQELQMFKANYNGPLRDSVLAFANDFLQANETATQWSRKSSSLTLGLLATPFFNQYLHSFSLDSIGKLYFNDMHVEPGEKAQWSSVLKGAGTDQNILAGFVLSDSVNDPRYLQTDATISPDGSLLYFTRAIEAPGYELLHQIFYSVRTESGWSHAIRMNELINERGYSTRYPFLYSFKGEMHMLFSTNKPYGAGGFDIWEAKLGKDGQAVSSSALSDVINSTADEICPFYDPATEQLFFSSNGEKSIGGFDIYKAEHFDINWGKPQNMGFPYSSGADDLYYRYFQKQGFLISNRAYTGMDSVLFPFRVYSFVQQQLLLKVCLESGNASLSKFHVDVYENNLGEERKIYSQDIMAGGKDPGCTPFEVKVRPSISYRIVSTADQYNTISVQTQSPGPEDPPLAELKLRLNPKVTWSGNVSLHRNGTLDHPQSAVEILFYQKRTIGTDSLIQSVKVKPGSSSYTLRAYAGNRYRVKAKADGYADFDTVFSSMNCTLPTSFQYDIHLGEDMTGRNILVDSLKAVNGRIVLSTGFKSRLNEAIGHLQSFADEKFEVIVFCSRLPGHPEEAPVLPGELSTYLTDQLGESWHAVWDDELPVLSGVQRFVLYWKVTKSE